MKTFTAKQLHDNPSEVYRAAVKEPVKITHKHHGDFKMSIYPKVEQELDDTIKMIADDNPMLFGRKSLADMWSEHVKQSEIDTASGSDLDLLAGIDSRPEGMTDEELRELLKIKGA